MGLISAARLDRRVSILRRGDPVDDGRAERPGDWVLIGHRFASMKQRIGREENAAAGSDGVTPTSFWFRFDEMTRGIKTTDAIEYRGERYTILAPAVELGRMEGVEVVARAGGVPAA